MIKTMQETKVEKRTVTQTMLVLQETIESIKYMETRPKRQMALTDAIIKNLRTIMEYELNGKKWTSIYKFNDKGKLIKFDIRLLE